MIGYKYMFVKAKSYCSSLYLLPSLIFSFWIIHKNEAPGVPHSYQGSEVLVFIWSFFFFFNRRQWHPTPVLLPGKSHGWRSLVGYSPWGCSESDTTERLHFYFSPSCIGEGNGNPLQCSCLENPRDCGAWWTAVYGVTESDVTEAT